jgi:hypothetical protein
MRTKQSEKIIDAGIFIISAGVFATLVILAYQGYFWFKYGEWLSLQFYEVLQKLNIDFTKLLDMNWQGLQKLIFWTLERPFSLIIFVISLIIGLTLIMFSKIKINDRH